MSNSSFPSADCHISFNDFLDNILVDFPSQNPTLLSPGSDNSTWNHTSNSGSDDGETNKWKLVNSVDERLQKRLVSNRESARRSRKRKQKHLENLTNQAMQYEAGNQELVKRLRFVNHNGEVIRQENQRLRLEAVILQQKLHNLHQQLTNINQDLHQPLLPSAWPCNNNVTTINYEQNQPTLITF